MTPAFVTKTGVEIMDEDDTPEGELWFTLPLESGGKITYMLELADWKMRLANGDSAFIDELDRWLEQLGVTIATGQTPFAVAKIGLIREAVEAFKYGHTWIKKSS